MRIWNLQRVPAGKFQSDLCDFYCVEYFMSAPLHAWLPPDCTPYGVRIEGVGKGDGEGGMEITG